METTSFHYQPVRTQIGGEEYYSIHEAYSDEKGIYSVNEQPVVLQQESLDELILLLSCVNTDLKRYKIQDYHKLENAMKKHPNEQNIDESLDAFFDYHYGDYYFNNDGKVIELVEYFK